MLYGKCMDLRQGFRFNEWICRGNHVEQEWIWCLAVHRICDTMGCGSPKRFMLLRFIPLSCCSEWIEKLKFQMLRA